MRNKIKKGETIGVVAPSGAIIGENIDELNSAIEIVKKDGYNVKLSKNIYNNKYGYSNCPKEKAEDINQMFKDKDIKVIWCAKGGENANSVLEYLDYDTIKENPKIFCGYSDITSLANLIYEKTGNITFSSTNFKTIATDETRFSYEKALEMFEGKCESLGEDKDYKILKHGKAKGKLIGGNLSLIRGLVDGEYKINFENKILFIEELGYETSPALASNYLAYMKQNGVFDKISALWIGNYEHSSNIQLEQIVLDTIGENINIPIIKSDNFGHIERKIAIPIGVDAVIDTSEKQVIKISENIVK